jgi:Arc/MetJ-type ribon-helix-helix transcriptional regulator
MIIHLHPHIESSIQAAVHSGRYGSLDDAMTDDVSMLLQRLKLEQAQAKPAAASEPEAGQATKSIWHGAALGDGARSIYPMNELRQ